jgi:TRAP-type C4-dicarboxylate transport system permease small subunit
MNYTAIVIFIILAFVQGFVLITYKDTIPKPLKRWLAIFAIVMLLLAFGLMIYGFLMAANPNAS